ncbi:hypothetical protein Lal_00045195 [Lupinus albus]|nr:hypothetical protein Lal_00045195 [Lupinus albus]
MPTATHLGTARPGRHLNRAHFSEGQGDRRDVVWLRQTRPHLGINHDEPPMVHFRMIGNLPLRAKDMPVEASPSATTFRAERVTLDASARPRDGRNYPL